MPMVPEARDRFATPGHLERALAGTLGSETAPVPAGPAYTVEAALYRAGGAGRRERLESGDRLALGGNLSLEFHASREVHPYVINEDERGRSRSWIVDTAGGREHLLLLASPDRLVEFEAGLSHLPRPEVGA